MINDGPGYDGAHSAGQSNGDSGERWPDQFELDGLDGQYRGDGVLGRAAGPWEREFCTDWHGRGDRDDVQRHGFGGVD